MIKGDQNYTITSSKQREPLNFQKTKTGLDQFVENTIEGISILENIDKKEIYKSIGRNESFQQVFQEENERERKKLKIETQKEVVNLVKKKQKNVQNEVYLNTSSSKGSHTTNRLMTTHHKPETEKEKRKKEYKVPKMIKLHRLFKEFTEYIVEEINKIGGYNPDHPKDIKFKWSEKIDSILKGFGQKYQDEDLIQKCFYDSCTKKYKINSHIMIQIVYCYGSNIKKTTIRERIFKDKTEEGVSLSFINPINSIENLIEKNKVIGQIYPEDDYPSLTNDVIIDRLTKDSSLYYIGYLKKINNSNKSINSFLRILDLNVIYAVYLKKLYNDHHFKENLKGNHVVYLSDWGDGFSVIKQPFFTSTSWLEFDSNIFKDNSKSITIPHLYLYGFIKEEIENLYEIGKIKCDQFKSLSKEIKLNDELSITLKPKFLLGDHSYLRKLLGIATTQEDSCEMCEEKISTLKIQNIKELTLDKIRNYLINKKGKDIGIKRESGLFGGSINTPLKDNNMDELIVLSDNLHQVKGVNQTLLNLLKGEKEFNVEGCEEAIESLIGHSIHQGLSGEDLRYVFCNYQSTILPFIKHSTNNIDHILLNWNQIQYILYLSDETKVKLGKDKLVESLRLLVWIFKLGIDNRWGNLANNSYTHNVINHMTTQFLNISSFQAHSCEPGEKSNSIIKKIIKNTTNRRAKDCNLYPFLKVLIQTKKHYNTPKLSRVSTTQKNFILENVLIPSSISNDPDILYILTNHIKSNIKIFENGTQIVQIWSNHEIHPLIQKEFLSEKIEIVEKDPKDIKRCVVCLEVCGKTCSHSMCALHCREHLIEQRKSEPNYRCAASNHNSTPTSKKKKFQGNIPVKF